MGKPSRFLLALTFAFAIAAGASSARPLSPPSREQAPATPTAPPSMRPSIPAAPAGPDVTTQLYADSCASPSDCWAVGFDANQAGAKLGRALHFHGGTWSAVSVPDPGFHSAGGYDYLDAVDCVSPTDCWAVGYYGNKSHASRNEALHWNGKKWQNVGIAQPAGIANEGDQNQLNGVSCATASNCWAVGDYTNRAGAELNEAFSWNGKKWTLVPTPNSHGTAKGDDNVLYSVGCSSKSDCLSVGYGRNRTGEYASEAQRWTGTAWKALPTPRPGKPGTHGYAYLEGLACESASECWAAGGYNNKRGDKYSNEIVRWNGSSWRRVSTPDPGKRAGGSELNALSCASPKSCWAVGYYYKSSGERAEALRWNGKRWSLAATPHPSRNPFADPLRGVSCASPAKCWAVGYLFSPPGLSLGKFLLEWNGKKWSVG